MIVKKTKNYKHAYHSIKDQPGFKNRDKNPQKTIIYDLNSGLPDTEDEIKEKWNPECKRKKKRKKRKKKNRNVNDN